MQWDSVPADLQHFFLLLLGEVDPSGAHKYNVKLFVFYVFLWMIWNSRNKMRMEKKFIRSTNELFYNFFALLQSLLTLTA